MDHRSLWFLIFAFATLTACRPAAAPVSVSNRPVSINDVPITRPLGEMGWTAEDGTAAKVKNLNGKVVILDFWATYCPPCKDEVPHLNELRSLYDPNDLEVIGLNVGGDEDRPKIAGFRQSTPFDYPVAFPDDDLVKFVFGADSRIPQTVVLDRSGKLVKKIVGFDAGLKKELDGAVQEALR